MNKNELYNYICEVELNSEFIFSLTENKCVLFNSYKKHPLDRNERYLPINKDMLETLLNELKKEKYLYIDKVVLWQTNPEKYIYNCHLSQKGLDARIYGIETYEKNLIKNEAQKESKQWHEQTGILYAILATIYVTIGLFRSNPHAILVFSIILVPSLLLNVLLFIKYNKNKKR